MSQRCERMSEQMSQWPIVSVWVLCYSELILAHSGVPKERVRACEKVRDFLKWKET